MNRETYKAMSTSGYLTALRKLAVVYKDPLKLFCFFYLVKDNNQRQCFGKTQIG